MLHGLGYDLEKAFFEHSGINRLQLDRENVKTWSVCWNNEKCPLSKTFSADITTENFFQYW